MAKYFIIIRVLSYFFLYRKNSRTYAATVTIIKNKML